MNVYFIEGYRLLRFPVDIANIRQGQLGIFEVEAWYFICGDTYIIKNRKQMSTKSNIIRCGATNYIIGRGVY